MERKYGAKCQEITRENHEIVMQLCERHTLPNFIVLPKCRAENVEKYESECVGILFLLCTVKCETNVPISHYLIGEITPNANSNTIKINCVEILLAFPLIQPCSVLFKFKKFISTNLAQFFIFSTISLFRFISLFFWLYLFIFSAETREYNKRSIRNSWNDYKLNEIDWICVLLENESKILSLYADSDWIGSQKKMCKAIFLN